MDPPIARPSFGDKMASVDVTIFSHPSSLLCWLCSFFCARRLTPRSSIGPRAVWIQSRSNYGENWSPRRLGYLSSVSHRKLPSRTHNDRARNYFCGIKCDTGSGCFIDRRFVSRTIVASTIFWRDVSSIFLPF